MEASLEVETPVWYSEYGPPNSGHAWSADHPMTRSCCLDRDSVQLRSDAGGWWPSLGSSIGVAHRPHHLVLHSAGAVCCSTFVPGGVRKKERRVRSGVEVLSVYAWLYSRFMECWGLGFMDERGVPLPHPLTDWMGLIKHHPEV